jgi:hypothetical protein
MLIPLANAWVVNEAMMQTFKAVVTGGGKSFGEARPSGNL